MISDAGKMLGLAIAIIFGWGLHTQADAPDEPNLLIGLGCQMMGATADVMAHAST